MSFLWFDFETFGTNPVVDRPCQFAAIRTDDDFESEDEAVSIFCAPADDVLPNPYACLVTGITPQKAKRDGVNEATFAQTIYEQMSQAHTCSVGFNSLRFDDEVTRQRGYRNGIDPYAREWKNGNTRWDLINLARACYALRPDGIEWPPAPGFRLEDLTVANSIEHGDAHDALADVRATLDGARRINHCF